MVSSGHLIIALVISLLTSCDVIADDPSPLVIAHRGSSGVLPEHTIAAYQQAIIDGADYVECDVTLTRDLVAVCLHENWLRHTTDVASRPQFAGRRRNRTVVDDGGEVTVDDWFAVDFTLQELKTLRTRQRFEFRDRSHDGKFPIATLEEHLSIVVNSTRKVGTYPELKNPGWINSLDIMNGTKFEDIVLQTLAKYGFTNRDDACIIQSFSEVSLNYLVNRTRLRLTILIEDTSILLPSKFTEWGRHGFYAVGPWINLISSVWTPENEYKNRINFTTDLVDQCHRNKLQVHAYTFRNEDRFLPWDFGQDIGNAYSYYFSQMSVDGFFTDFPATLVNFRHNLQQSDQCKQMASTITVNTHLFTVLFCYIIVRLIF